MKKIKSKLWALVAVVAMVVICGFGLLDKADWTMADRWYQEPQASGGDIVLVEIDQATLEAYGPFKDWDRTILADASYALNQSEDCRPAAIGIDILYAGHSTEEGDAALAEAAGRYGNVVTTVAAEYSSGIREDGNGNFYYDDFYISGYDEPFEELKEVTTQGHVNAMYDTDGVLRHHLWELNMDDGTTIPSFAEVIANMYLDYYGEGPVNTPPINGQGFWYLSFSGEPGDYSESIPLYDVIEGNIPPEYFADRIVLIGPYAAGLQDSYITSMDHAVPMYGVEFQANVIEALLYDDFKQEVGDAVQLAALFVVLVICLWGMWKRPVVPSTILWLVVSVGYLVLCKWMYNEKGLVLRVLWIPLSVTVFYVGSIAINYIWSVLEKRRVTKTFKRYVDEKIVDELLNEEEEAAAEPRGKVVEIAVLFVDVRGFTTMSEALTPSEVVEILNRYLTLIANCILDNNGTLDKFIGDAAMAFWGAPQPQEDFIMNACKAAIAMREGSDALSKELLERFGRTVSFGIGINVGEAVVGNIGSPDRMDYTAIGDTVNTSSRLESIAPARTIYLSEAVVKRLEGRIRVSKLDHLIHLKGKAEDQQIYILEDIIE